MIIKNNIFCVSSLLLRLRCILKKIRDNRDHVDKTTDYRIIHNSLFLHVCNIETKKSFFYEGTLCNYAFFLPKKTADILYNIFSFYYSLFSLNKSILSKKNYEKETEYIIHTIFEWKRKKSVIEGVEK